MKSGIRSFLRWIIRLGLAAALVTLGYVTREWLEPEIRAPTPVGWQGMEWQAPGARSACSGLVPYRRLMSALPQTLPGWEEQEPPYGTCFAHQDYAYTMVRLAWSREPSVLTLKIMDCRHAPSLIENLAQAAAFSEEDTVHYRRGLTGSAFRGFEAWYADEKRGEIQLALYNRFWLSIEGYELESPDILRKVLAKVALGRLERLHERFP